jgi:integrase
MAERRQLPPQIRRVEIKQRGSAKPPVRYQLTVDTGYVDGKRKQLRRRYETEQEARKALAEVQGKVASGTYVQPTKLTVEQACAQWLASRHKIKPTSAAGYEYVLQPIRSELGDIPVQKLTRRHIDDVIQKLRQGGLERSNGRARRPWSTRSCNYLLTALRQVLGQLVAEGMLVRNVALLVDRVSGKPRGAQTFTAKQVAVVLDSIKNDRNRHAWHMALTGMRRGEIAGQRWEDSDLENKLIRIGRARVDIKGRVVESDDAKSDSSNRTLPIPDALLAELKSVSARQAAEKLYLGTAYSDLGYVVCNEAGEPYHPSTLSKLWSSAIADLDVPQLRLHDARHTFAMRLQVRGIAFDASFGVVGDRESVRDFGFGASAGPVWRYGRHAI